MTGLCVIFVTGEFGPGVVSLDGGSCTVAGASSASGTVLRCAESGLSTNGIIARLAEFAVVRATLGFFRCVNARL